MKTPPPPATLLRVESSLDLGTPGLSPGVFPATKVRRSAGFRLDSGPPLDGKVTMERGFLLPTAADPVARRGCTSVCQGVGRDGKEIPAGSWETLSLQPFPQQGASSTCKGLPSCTPPPPNLLSPFPDLARPRLRILSDIFLGLHGGAGSEARSPPGGAGSRGVLLPPPPLGLQRAGALTARPLAERLRNGLRVWMALSGHDWKNRWDEDWRVDGERPVLARDGRESVSLEGFFVCLFSSFFR